MSPNTRVLKRLDYRFLVIVLLLSALLSQDMYLAGSFLMMLSTLTVLGTLLSDILLALVDPRIRLGA